MQFKKIVGFGDSWTHGDELVDPELQRIDPDAHYYWDQNTAYRERHCYLGQLAKHYGVPCENFGISGGSLTSTQWTFQWWLDHETVPLQDCLVVIGLTSSTRITHYNPNHVHYSNDPPWNRFVHSSWMGSSAVSDEFEHMIKQQQVLTNCPELEHLNYQHAVLFFDGVAARNHFNLLQFNIMPGQRVGQSIPTLMEPDFSFTQWFKNHPHNQQRELVKPQGHPNETGHGLIKQRLISWIESCTIKGC